MSNNTKSKKSATAVEKQYAPTSEKTRAWFLRNGYTEDQIPALAKDAVPMMQAHIDNQRLRRAGPPSPAMVKYLLDHGWARSQVDTMTFAEASKLIYKSKLALGLVS